MQNLTVMFVTAVCFLFLLQNSTYLPPEHPIIDIWNKRIHIKMVAVSVKRSIPMLRKRIKVEPSTYFQFLFFRSIKCHLLGLGLKCFMSFILRGQGLRPFEVHTYPKFTEVPPSGLFRLLKTDFLRQMKIERVLKTSLTLFLSPPAV